jgi:thioredoxin-disulfide reductase
MKCYDIAIIGGGSAGLTSALYAVRNGLKVAVISKDIGGMGNSILQLDNWPGYSGSGAVLMKQFYDQVHENYDVEFLMTEVEKVTKEGKDFKLKLKKEDICAKTVIVATGTERRKLGIKGEDTLEGKGVSYCVTCDGFFFKNKVTAVIGGSDCASISALALSEISKKVYVLYRGEKLRCEAVTSKKISEKENIEVIYHAVPKEFIGEEKLEGIKIEKDGKEETIDVDGAFIEIGSVPITKFLDGLGVETDNENHLLVNHKTMETNIQGLYAAGDVTDQKLKQVVVATGHGAIAAKEAYEYIVKKY